MTTRPQTPRLPQASTPSGPSTAAAAFRVAAVALLFVPVLLLAEEPPKVDRLEIVDRAIAYHGGELYTASATELDVCSKSGCYHVLAKLDGERFEYEITGRVSAGERRVLWMNDWLEAYQNGAPVPAEGAEAQRYKDWVMERVYFPFLPFRLNDPSVFKQDFGLEEWHGRKLHKVKVTFVEGSSTDADDEYLYWFDPETGQVEQFAYSYSGNTNGLRFRRAHNHRRIGGILFFDQENLGLEGKGLSVDAIDPAYVKTLRKVSDVRFEKISVR